MWKISSDVRDDGLSSLVLLHFVQGLLRDEVGKYPIRLNLRHYARVSEEVVYSVFRCIMGGLILYKPSSSKSRV